MSSTIHSEGQRDFATDRLRTRASLRARMWQHRGRYLFMLPGIIYFIVFAYIPLAGNIIAFQDYSPFIGFLDSPFVGLQNFRDFVHDPEFLQALKNTIQIEILQLVFAFPAPLALALLLNSIISNSVKRTIQSIIYLPHFLSWVIVIAMWQQIFGGVGFLNGVLTAWGWGNVNVMTNPGTFKLLVVAQSIWKDIGWGTIIFLAALTKIDVQLYEAAVVDGANGWRRLRDVTLPGIKSIVILLLILRLGSSLSVGFEQYFLQQNAVGADAAQVLDTFVYFRGVQAADWSFATAVGLVRSIFGAFLIFGANWAARKFSGGEEGIF